MTYEMILLLVLILMVIGPIPGWPPTRGWGHVRSGVFGFVLVAVVVLLLAGRIQ